MAADANSTQLHGRFAGQGPKRILSIDGGGMRGAIAAGILSEIERRLKRRSGKADFRLSDYFDLISGGSTGAVLAAALALGKTVDEAARLYEEFAPTLGNDPATRVRKPRLDLRQLDAVLAREFGDYELGSLALRTGFAVFTKRLDTGTTATITNNPNSPFWEAGKGSTIANRRLPIRKLVLASIGGAALFEERSLKLAPDSEQAAEGLYIDSAAAGFDNPGLQLLKAVTLPAYGFNWAAGDDRLLMISVGAGYWRPSLNQDVIDRDLFHPNAPPAARAIYALRSLAHDAALDTLSTLQGLSESPKPWALNAEVGEMRNARLSPVPVLHFQRLDVRLDDPAELARIGAPYDKAAVEAMKDMLGDDGGNLARLYEIGASAGHDYFKRGRNEPEWENLIFPARFDPAWFSGPPPGPPRSRIEAMGRFGQQKR